MRLKVKCIIILTTSPTNKLQENHLRLYQKKIGSHLCMHSSIYMDVNTCMYINICKCYVYAHCLIESKIYSPVNPSFFFLWK